LNEITEAIEARQAQMTQLQRDIETLSRAAAIMGGQAEASPKATSRPTSKTQSKQKRSIWSAADKQAISKRMKAYWAKRRKAKRRNG